MRKLLVTLMMCITAVVTCLAQPYPSRLGRFEVDQVKGCAPLTVNVTIIPPFVCNSGSPCDMDYESNNSFQNLVFTYQYTQPGTYSLRILFQTLGFDDITITVTPDISPTFNIFSCSGNSSHVAITDTNYEEYVINYNDGSPEVVVPRGSPQDDHTFGTAGTKLVSIRGRNAGSDDNCTSMNRPVDAMPVLPTPTINQLQVLDAGSVRLDFNATANVLYKLEMATDGTTFVPLRDVYNATTQTISGLTTDANYYCFRFGVFDPCSGMIISYSNTICSADLDATAVNNANALTWSTHSAGVGFYTFSRTPSFPIPVSRPGSESTLSDTDVQCNVEYCYQMTTRYSNGSQSISLSKCVTAISDDTPPITDDISILVTGPTTLDVVWTQDPMYTPSEYTFYQGGAAYGKSDMAFFTDNSFILNAGDCYAVSYVDACGNASPVSKTVCPIILTGDLQSDNTVDIAWNAYTGWANGVDHYMLEKYSHDGQLLGSFNTGTSTTYPDDNIDLDNQIVIYRVIAYPVGGVITESISNDVTIIREPHIYHPTAFTPNNDGLNDTFEVHSMFTAQVEFMVFNRWGEMLFYTTDLNQRWDGTYKGSAVPEGTYVFRAFLTDQTGKQYERAGNVVLLRKK